MTLCLKAVGVIHYIFYCGIRWKKTYITFSLDWTKTKTVSLNHDETNPAFLFCDATALNDHTSQHWQSLHFTVHSLVLFVCRPASAWCIKCWCRWLWHFWIITERLLVWTQKLGGSERTGGWGGSRGAARLLTLFTQRMCEGKETSEEWTGRRQSLANVHHGNSVRREPGVTAGYFWTKAKISWVKNRATRHRDDGIHHYS